MELLGQGWRPVMVVCVCMWGRGETLVFFSGLGGRRSVAPHAAEAESLWVFACARAAGYCCDVRRYSFPKKKGAAWMVGAMRFRSLWEHPGPEVVVVLDIHDDLSIQCRQVCGLCGHASV